MPSEDRNCFKAKLRDIALSSYKHLNDNCIHKNNLSSEELHSLKNLIRNKNITRRHGLLRSARLEHQFLGDHSKRLFVQFSEQTSNGKQWLMYPIG